ncbi:hypothetical protein [Paraglaciecola sp. MB-3u-78]|uniref:hypothetical protein n=1 Tax=Paraglaciecola sp. MB-3u-78 TaxID=2058332 RepID=UPI000C343A93|nr:hypothetical protein [Paraglaciecola sp. MB-3u-78]PKG97663.1 hypothetical protein CXF95_14475 [Paraglaciecola sp. MB-3u-78]
MSNNIGMEVIRLALEDANLAQKQIEELVCSSDTGGDLLNLTHKQTLLIESIVELFNRID